MAETEKPRILLVSAFPPDEGRLSEYAAALVNELTQRYNLHLEILTDCPSPQTPSVSITPTWRPDSVPSIMRLYARIISAKTRVIHFNLHMAVFGKGRLVNFLGLLTPAIAKIAGKRVIVTLHNIPVMLKLEAIGMANNTLNRIGLWLAANLVAMASDILVVTMRSYINIVRKWYRAKEVVWIPHGAWFTEKQPRWRWKGSGNILFLGYIAPYKDLDSLVCAVKKIAEKKRVKLLISGGPHPNFYKEGLELMKSIENQPYVELLGRVPDNKLPKLLEDVDLVVLPYKTSTGTSGVLHLLSALGPPFVVSDTPEFRELAREGAGVLVTRLEPNELAESIEKVMLRKDLAEQLSRRSVEFAFTRSWREVARQYVRLYSRLMAD